MNRVNAKERLICALDVPSAKEAQELVGQLDGLVSFFKIGIELYCVTGSDFVRSLVKNGKKVFLDLKYFDVGETVSRAVAQVTSLGASFLTVHGNGEIIRAALRGRGASDLKILAVTLLTSLDAEDIRDLGFPCSVQELVLLRARKAHEAGCDGIIASGREVKGVREIVGDRLLIVSPGIRTAGTRRDDQKRVATPSEAIEAGADYLVIGRPIKNAQNPREAAEEILREMQEAFDRRIKG